MTEFPKKNLKRVNRKRSGLISIKLVENIINELSRNIERKFTALYLGSIRF